MEKKYTRKPIRNLRELEKAQDRTRNMYKDMESDWVSNFLQPDTWAFSIGQYLLTRLLKKKNRKNRAETPVGPASGVAQPLYKRRRWFGPKKARSAGKKQALAGHISGIAKRFRVRKNQMDHTAASGRSAAFRLLKKLMWSVIYWQAFRIGFRIGREGGRALRQKKNRH